MKNKKRVYRMVGFALNGSFTNGKLSYSKIEKIIAEFKKLPTSQAITYLTEYLKALKRKIDQSVLYIESAQPLSTEQKNKITRAFRKNNTITQTMVKINPSLFGGVLIKLSDMVYEDTLNSRITQLKEGLING